MGVTQTRVSQIERTEPTGAVQLSTLQRAAAAMNCELVYCFEPNESLEEMVWRRAFFKAADKFGIDEAELADDDPAYGAEVRMEQVGAMAYALVDGRGLWTGPDQPEASAGPVPPGPPASWRGGP